jgi:hypothetical protein
MVGDFARVFSTLKDVLARHEQRLAVSADCPTEYTVLTRTASPFPQHKGHPMYFGSVRLGKAYVSFHLMPLYMSPKLTGRISPALKKRMQGKTCFNFKGRSRAAVVAGTGIADRCRIERVAGPEVALKADIIAPA